MGNTYVCLDFLSWAPLSPPLFQLCVSLHSQKYCPSRVSSFAIGLNPSPPTASCLMAVCTFPFTMALFQYSAYFFIYSSCQLRILYEKSLVHCLPINFCNFLTGWLKYNGLVYMLNHYIIYWMFNVGQSCDPSLNVHICWYIMIIFIPLKPWILNVIQF